jgi:hypothetical protein
MPKIETINDRDSYILPTVSNLRNTQQEGMCCEGMNDNDCTELNSTQGHQADIKEFTDGPQVAKLVRRGMIQNNDADISRLDRTERGSWPEITEL